MQQEYAKPTPTKLMGTREINLSTAAQSIEACKPHGQNM
jgi:hypothetical protein